MGTSGSKVKKLFAPSSGHGKEHRRRCDPASMTEDVQIMVNSNVIRVPSSLGPLIMYRQGSMYFDEDGDLAHEFYVEVKEGRKSKMKRIYHNLTPQGKIKLPFPRLSNDCPVVLYAI